MLTTNILDNFKNNKFYIILFLFFLFYPISLVFGPALIEITIFFSILTFSFLVLKKKLFLEDSIINTKFIFVFLFILICILSSLLSDNTLHSLKSSFFLIRFFLYSLIIFILLKRPNNAKNFLKFNIIFILICLIDAYIQLIFGKNIFLYDTSTDFVTGFFFEEKKLGRFLITLSPILVGMYLSLDSGNINTKVINSLLFCIIIYMITLFTSERVSMFYSGFTFMILILFSSRLSKKYLLFIIVPIFISISSYYLGISKFNYTVKDTINQITENKTSFSYPSAQHRSFMETSYKLFSDNPILGIGPNNYRNKCSEIILKNVNNCSTHPHNIFFQVLSETGLLGLLIYIYYLFFIIQKILLFIFSRTSTDTSIFFLLPILYYLNPFFPSGNFFNNWFMAIGTFAIPFYLYFNEITTTKN